MWLWFSLQSHPERRNTVFVVASQRLGEASLRRKRSVYYWWSLSYVNWVDRRSTAVSGECIARRMGHQIWLRLRANTRPPNKARKRFWRQLWADSMLKRSGCFAFHFYSTGTCGKWLSKNVFNFYRQVLLLWYTLIEKKYLLLQQGA